jgi:hypothetical protein
VQLDDTVDVCGGAEIDFSGDRGLDDLAGGLGHYLLDTSKHYVLL